MKRFYVVLFLFALSLIVTSGTVLAQSPLSISNIADNKTDYANNDIPTYEKFEITFQVDNSVAGNLQFPYDSNPPNGIDPSYSKHNGISVDAEFTPDNWTTVYRQPAFYYQYFTENPDGSPILKQSWDGTDHEWMLPLDQYAWKVRFSPHQAGDWKYRLNALDAGGQAQSQEYPFTVTQSNNKGFLQVSQSDTRYFEFENGTPFLSNGFQVGGRGDKPVLYNEPLYQELDNNDIRFLRQWKSSQFGTAWLEWLGGRNQYNGYLPRPGYLPFTDTNAKQDLSTLHLDYEPEGDVGWFDACRFQFWNDPEAVKQNTDYRMQVTYWGMNMTGPRDPAYPEYGFVSKIGDWDNDCYNPSKPGDPNWSMSTPVTNYGDNTTGWSTVEGIWNSGTNDFLPRVNMALENVHQGDVYIRSISLREDLGNGQYGPEIFRESSFESELYFPEQAQYGLDKQVELAEQYDMYLKWVLMEKNDAMYFKLDNDGTFVINGEGDNMSGFYGLGRGMNKTRWLQKAWWRYLQARWGYSTAIHSWEVTNEGDPWTTKHYELTDEMGKYFHCEVFGEPIASGDGQKCLYDHPNDHMVTTSFWHSFPAIQFWENVNYPNVDYADVHAYISTSNVLDYSIPGCSKADMEVDAAAFHTCHSIPLEGWKLGKPIVRGEAGMDSAGSQNQTVLGLDQDTTGVWYHNYTWAGLDSGAMYELYWWARDHVWDESNNLFDHRPHYKVYADFISTIPLNNGNYEDIAATVPNTNLRVLGQKDLVNGNAHVWIQNKNHTWKNVVDSVGITSEDGGVVICGFDSFANQTLNLETWNTYQPFAQGVNPIVSTIDIQNTGCFTLSVQNLTEDVAYKIVNPNASVSECYDASIALDATQETDPTIVSAGVGSGTIHINTTSNTLDYDISFSGLTSSESGAHIHGPASRGTNAGILQDIGIGSPKQGSWDYQESQEQDVVNGLTYINIHSSNYPSGEIRGQLDNLTSVTCSSPTQPGDTDGDDDVDISDLSTLLATFGSIGTGLSADFDGDDDVDISDLSTLLANFGTSN